MSTAAKYLSHEELQHIEHCNIVLKEHLEIVRAVVNESESLLHTYLPILNEYVRSVGKVTQEFGENVSNIYRSSRELKVSVGSTPEVINFIATVQKLDALLTPELIVKLRRITKDE